MFEIIITFICLILVFFVSSIWLKVFLITVSILLISTGFYAIFSGAPYLPTKKEQFSAMKKLAKFGNTDVVYDLGCGDGRLVRGIEKIGVSSVVGYEFSFLTFLWAKFLGGDIRFGNFWEKDFSDGTVLVCFLLPGPMSRFGKEIWPTLKKGTRVVSNIFPIKGFIHDMHEDGVYLYVKK